jgi:hypothetical protein
MAKPTKKKQRAGSMNTVTVIGADLCVVRQGVGRIAIHNADDDSWDSVRKGWRVDGDGGAHRRLNVSYNKQPVSFVPRNERRRRK